MTDRTVKKLYQLYSEMFLELTEKMEELGGTLDKFSAKDSIIHVTVEPELQAYAEEYIQDLIAKYNKKRSKILNNDIFIGVKTMLSKQGKYELTNPNKV